MADPSRELTRQLFEQFRDSDTPLGWFEALYAKASGDPSLVPWADGKPNPNLVRWCEANPRRWASLRTCVVGCGLGDDAEYLASLGATTTAFDLADSAIGWATRRFPNSAVAYQQQDLFTLPATLRGRFDFVFECYTLQAMPAKLRQNAFGAVASLLAPGGELLLLSRGRDAHDPEGNLPWPLTRQEVESLRRYGLTLQAFEDFDDPFEPGKRRFRALLRKP